jgi:hypothetical protein
MKMATAVSARCSDGDQKICDVGCQSAAVGRACGFDADANIADLDFEDRREGAERADCFLHFVGGAFAQIQPQQNLAQRRRQDLRERFVLRRFQVGCLIGLVLSHLENTVETNCLSNAPQADQKSTAIVPSALDPPQRDLGPLKDGLPAGKLGGLASRAWGKWIAGGVKFPAFIDLSVVYLNSW